jgi:hypothetical protein
MVADPDKAALVKLGDNAHIGKDMRMGIRRNGERQQAEQDDQTAHFGTTTHEIYATLFATAINFSCFLNIAYFL